MYNTGGKKDRGGSHPPVREYSNPPSRLSIYSYLKFYVRNHLSKHLICEEDLYHMYSIILHHIFKKTEDSRSSNMFFSGHSFQSYKDYTKYNTKLHTSNQNILI